MKKLKFSHMIKTIIIFLYCAGSLTILLAGAFFSAFTYCSDDVIVENGVKMIARDTSYLGFSMEYYEYGNALFRSEQLLKEIRNKTYWIYDPEGELIETGTYDH